MTLGNLNGSQGPQKTMTHAVSHSKVLFLVQTTHSAHNGTPSVLQGVTVQKIHNRSEKSKSHVKMASCCWTTAFSVMSTLTLKAVATLGHNGTSHVHSDRSQAEG